MTKEEKVKLQERALRNVSYVPCDRDNIAAMMPLLLPHQVENAYKAETRFLNEPGHARIGVEWLDCVNKGILFTDNVGSGKTYTGLAIAKRTERRGYSDILIIVPTDSKIKDWQKEALFFQMFFRQLKDTHDGGVPGEPVITTYANYYQNVALIERSAKRPFALVIYDESHKLVSNEKGKETQVDNVHKFITNAPTVAWKKAQKKYESIMKADELSYGRVQSKTYELVHKEERRLIDATKVVFLSATPFAYHKNLLYADGYLFKIMQGEYNNAISSYNNFFINNFGYRMRNSRLTEPDASIDLGFMERQFHTLLTKSGAISTTLARNDMDYSREFVLMDDQLGQKIDDGYRLGTDSTVYKFLPQLFKNKFDATYVRLLMESIKARLYIPRIKEHLAMGRKVVIFHSLVNNQPSHPFDFNDFMLWDSSTLVRTKEELLSFYNRYPEYKNLDLTGIVNPISTLTAAFGDRIRLFNGNVSTKDRARNKALFNEDGSGVDILLLQMEAGKEGIDLHDKTRRHQRVMANLALPERPTDAIQTEGRIDRIGQETDAIFEYPCLHLGIEKIAFGTKINKRASTAENFAFGEHARNLKDAFKEGYKTPTMAPPGVHQGKNGKESDMSFDVLHPFDKAIKIFHGRGKRTAMQKSKEGVDYYATPEPCGYKYVEWLQAKANEHLLEPSAGHGAIARYFPENTVNKFIEPSYELRADLSLNATGSIIDSTFEEHHQVNKYHGIVMNPPFGKNADTAVRHMLQAFEHMQNGARLIITLPDGPAMTARLEKWRASKYADNLFVTAVINMPGVMFSNAGTRVRTQVLIIDKQESLDSQRRMPSCMHVDLSDIEDIDALFMAIRDIEAPPRVKPGDKMVVPSGMTGRVTKAIIMASKHTKTDRAIWTIKLIYKPTPTEMNRYDDIAKSLKGYYSDYTQNKAIPGFIFYRQENANKMLKIVNS